MRGYLIVRRSEEERKPEILEIETLREHEAEMNPVLLEISERMENPPATWKSYAGHSNELMGVIDMEYRELVQAKSGGSTADIEKELTDLAAACAKALTEIKAR